MALKLAEMKEYLRVDTNDQDGIIKALIVTAKHYVYGKTDKRFYIGHQRCNSNARPVKLEDAPMFIMGQMNMVVHWYENRGVETVGTTITRHSKVGDELINHITLCGDYI